MTKFPRETCGGSYAQKQHLTRHKKRDHSSSVPLYHCPNCPTKFKYKSQVKGHQAAHSDARPFSCDNCEQTFKYKRDLRDHAQSAHFFDPSYDCVLCKRRFDKKSHLAVHMRSHIQERPYNCKHCKNISFTTNGQLQQHLKFVHSDKKYEFTCAICEKGFKRKASLRNHLVTKHGESEERALRCEVCDKLFRTAGDLKSHMRSHNLLHKCDICQKGFTSIANLGRHISSHLKEKPFPCYFCNKWFAREENLFGHLRSYLKELPFKCVTCGKQFTQSSNLTYHSKLH